MYLCPMRTLLHTIGPSDTLQLLAQRYNTTVHAIMIANPGMNPSTLSIGQVICIRPGPGYPGETGAAPEGTAWCLDQDEHPPCKGKFIG